VSIVCYDLLAYLQGIKTGFNVYVIASSLVGTPETLFAKVFWQLVEQCYSQVIKRNAWQDKGDQH